MLALRIQGMVEDSETIPVPPTLDKLEGDPAMQGAVVFLVSASAPDALVRVNTTARKSQMEEIDVLERGGSAVLEKHGRTE